MKYDRYPTTNNYIKIILMNFNHSINNLKIQSSMKHQVVLGLLILFLSNASSSYYEKKWGNISPPSELDPYREAEYDTWDGYACLSNILQADMGHCEFASKYLEKNGMVDSTGSSNCCPAEYASEKMICITYTPTSLQELTPLSLYTGKKFIYNEYSQISLFYQDIINYWNYPKIAIAWNFDVNSYYLAYYAKFYSENNLDYVEMHAIHPFSRSKEIWTGTRDWFDTHYRIATFEIIK